ncbi:hypothetical protein ACLB1E_36975 [Escherichia coli]
MERDLIAFVTRLCPVFHPQQLARHARFSHFRIEIQQSGITSSDAEVSLGLISFSSVSWDISAGNGYDREEALKRAKNLKNG